MQVQLRGLHAKVVGEIPDGLEHAPRVLKDILGNIFLLDEKDDSYPPQYDLVDRVPTVIW